MWCIDKSYLNLLLYKTWVLDLTVEGFKEHFDFWIKTPSGITSISRGVNPIGYFLSMLL